MKTLKTLYCLFSILSLAVFPLCAADYQSAEAPGHLSVTGTSTVHDWEVETSTLNGNLSEKDGLISALKVSVPVETLKSDKEGLDKKMYTAMDKDKYQSVTFTLTGAEKNKEDETGATTMLTGDLTIKDVKKSVTFPVTVSTNENGQLVLEGTYKLDMKDYSVPPPKAMMGMIKAGPEVTVNFKWVLDKKASAP